MTIAQEYQDRVQKVLKLNISEKEKMDQIWNINEEYCTKMNFKRLSITFSDNSEIVFDKDIAHMFLRLDHDDYKGA